MVRLWCLTFYLIDLVAYFLVFHLSASHYLKMSKRASDRGVLGLRGQSAHWPPDSVGGQLGAA